jgi:uncharacterized protein (DUF433 family)
MPAGKVDRPADDSPEALRRRVADLERLVLRLYESRAAPIRTADEIEEFPSPPWEHLVARPHPWRRQLYLKGRNLTVRQLLGTMKASKLSEAEAARQLDLPAEAVREALRYAAENKQLLDDEAAYERLLLRHKGYGRGAAAVPG